MARSDSFLKKWASAPSQFERPADALIDRGWAGGAAEDPPEAKWENWWHNRVDEALAELESKGALQWFADVPYSVAATSHDEGQNWIAVLPSTGIKPGSAEDVGHWAPVGANASETLLGILRLGTQPEVDAGTLDDVAVTPKKLRWGFSASFTKNGYIAFPSWLLGFMIVWGTGNTESSTVTVSHALAFPNAALLAVCSHSSGEGAVASSLALLTTTSIKLNLAAGNNGSVWYLAVGH